MRQRHRERVREIVSAIWESWRANGDVAADPDEAARLIAVAESEWLVASRDQWMHPLDAIATLAAHDGTIPTGTRRTDLLDAERTRSGHAEGEWAALVARTAGVTPATAWRAWSGRAGRKPRAPLDKGRTALYRHFDADGTLLYVGIARDPDKRLALHGYTARWRDYSARCEIEWHETRQDALRAERAAIAAERPIFNVSGSLVDPAVAEAYLDRVAAAAVR